MRSDAPKPTPGAALLHLYPALSVALIAFNDWILKRHWPGWWSGKLSDIGICFLLPVVLTAAAEWALWLWARIRRETWHPAGPRLHLASCAVAGLYFALLQLSEGFSHFHTRWLHGLFPSRRFINTPDPTDLVALLMLPLAWLYLRQSQDAPAPRRGTSQR